MDKMIKVMKPLKSFILPGGSALAAHLHLCRTVARRAERLVILLAEDEPVGKPAIKYLNRLSDWFFVAARVANKNGADDVLWVPGANR
jgi:cob(I)alamin adenosyltransferase